MKASLNVDSLDSSSTSVSTSNLVKMKQDDVCMYVCIKLVKIISIYPCKQNLPNILTVEEEISMYE